MVKVVGDEIELLELELDAVRDVEEMIELSNVLEVTVDELVVVDEALE